LAAARSSYAAETFEKLIAFPAAADKNVFVLHMVLMMRRMGFGTQVISSIKPVNRFENLVFA